MVKEEYADDKSQTKVIWIHYRMSSPTPVRSKWKCWKHKENGKFLNVNSWQDSEEVRRSSKVELFRTTGTRPRTGRWK